MKIILKPALAAGIALASLAAPAMMAPAAAQTVQGLAVVNVPAVVANSNAFRTAQQQRPVTYKAQIDQANARRDAIAAQLQPLYTQFQTASKRPARTSRRCSRPRRKSSRSRPTASASCSRSWRRSS